MLNLYFYLSYSFFIASINHALSPWHRLAGTDVNGRCRDRWSDYRALGRHFFYQSLDSTRTPDGIFLQGHGYQLTDQQVNNIGGVAFAYVVGACLLSPCPWHTVRLCGRVSKAAR